MKKVLLKRITLKLRNKKQPDYISVRLFFYLSQIFKLLS
jgi:hypothetical protein